MQSGYLRKRVTLQAELPTPDGAGGYALGWTDIMSVWAEIAPLHGRETSFAGHLEGRVTHRVTLRYISNVTTEMRLLYGARAFNIRSVINRDEANQWLDLLAEEGVVT